MCLYSAKTHFVLHLQKKKKKMATSAFHFFIVSFWIQFFSLPVPLLSLFLFLPLSLFYSLCSLPHLPLHFLPPLPPSFLLFSLPPSSYFLVKGGKKKAHWGNGDNRRKSASSLELMVEVFLKLKCFASIMLTLSWSSQKTVTIPMDTF